MTDKQTHTIEVIGLDRSYLPKVMAFLRRYYGEKFYGADETYFDWQYLQTPCDWYAPQAEDGKIPVNAVLDDGGEIQAVHAYLPYDARTPWGGVRGVWDVEWINGSGVPGTGRVLAQHLLDHCDVYTGYGMNDLADIAFRKMGMTVSNEIFRRVAIIDRETLATQMAEAGFIGEAKGLPDACTLPDRPWHALEAAGAVPAPVLDNYAETTPFGVGRSPEWLAWRYDRNPYIKYTPVAADPDGTHGVAIARLENVVGTDLTACRLTDFLTMPGHERDLLEAVATFARSKGSLIMDYLTTSKTRAAAFDEGTQGEDHGVHKNPRVPYMYQPLNFNQRNAMNFVISAGPNAPAGIDLSPFHATKGDTDQDILRSPESAPAM
jgi:hypothetical protein